MRHDDAILLLTDFLAGRLDELRAAEVAQHLNGCPECRALEATWVVLAEGRTAHPSSAEIVGLALDSGALDAAAKKRVETHVVGCATCTREYRLVRSAEAGGEDDTEASTAVALGRVAEGKAWPSAPVARRWRSGALAALAACAALLYPAYLGLSRIPALDGEIDRLQARLAAVTEEMGDARRDADEARRLAERARAGLPGIVALHSLMSPVRGAGAPQRLMVTPGQSHLLVSLEAPLLSRGEQGLYVFDLLTAAGDVAWKTEVGADDLLRRLATSPEVVLAIPAERIPAGFYRLRLRKPGATQETLLDIRFEIVGP